ncbi:hypothetical protein KQI52_03160 [bacterium]|nr:hypothetical protein [bacterium]
MFGRIVATIILIITLALLYLAPQGLLTKPILEETVAGPILMQTLETLDEGLAYRRIQDDGAVIDAESLAVYNDRIVDGDATVNLVRFTTLDTTMTEFPHLAGQDSEIWPRGEFLVAKFPYRGNWSPRLGKWKVYKGLGNEARARGLLPAPVLEIHDATAEEIRYLMPVKKQ